MIKEPIYIDPATAKSYERQLYEIARAQGWNEAMEFIFQEELEKQRSRIKTCWVYKSYGGQVCEHCQNRERCDVIRC